ncbi:MAG: hypothetical protein SWO11_04810 [Thermodesulfobacteriota bacterium]|nr:hypothetical protein [Thermodesulfobacteriota bacterium]
MKRYFLLIAILISLTIVIIPNYGMGALEVMTDSEMEAISAQGFFMDRLFPNPIATLVIGPMEIPLDPIVDIIGNSELLESVLDGVGVLLRRIGDFVE